MAYIINMPLNSGMPCSHKIKKETPVCGDLIKVNTPYLLNLFKKIEHQAYEVFGVSDDERGFRERSRDNATCYAFVARHPRPECYNVIYGGCRFAWGLWEKDKQMRFSLRWIWLHPRFRRNGVLSAHWKFFKEEYGDFHIQPPVSDQMQAFLAKQKAM